MNRSFISDTEKIYVNQFTDEAILHKYSKLQFFFYQYNFYNLIAETSLGDLKNINYLRIVFKITCLI